MKFIFQTQVRPSSSLRIKQFGGIALNFKATALQYQYELKLNSTYNTLT